MPEMPKVGESAPDFELSDAEGNIVRLSDSLGKWRVVYFYPKDNTPGCTKEACDFSERFADFEGLDAVVIGISTDSPESHRKFAAKHHLSITLLSDPEHEVIERYGAWQPKKMMGREFFGTVRSTFLVCPRGRVAHIWPAVKVRGHADEVRKVLSESEESEC